MLDISYSFAVMPFGEHASVTYNDDGLVMLLFPACDQDGNSIDRQELISLDLDEAQELATGLLAIIAAAKAVQTQETE